MMDLMIAMFGGGGGGGAGGIGLTGGYAPHVQILWDCTLAMTKLIRR